MKDYTVVRRGNITDLINEVNKLLDHDSTARIEGCAMQSPVPPYLHMQTLVSTGTKVVKKSG